LHEDDLSEHGLTIQPEEDPNVDWVRIVDYLEHESEPGERRQKRVDASPEYEP